MFTSRAEFRILLRQDNADERLTRLGHSVGLATTKRLKIMENKYSRVSKFIEYVNINSFTPTQVNAVLEEKKSAQLQQKTRISKIIIRPELSSADFKHLFSDSINISDTELEAVDIRLKYEGYIEKEKANAEKIQKFSQLTIPETIDYDKLLSISTEGRQKLKKLKPRTISDALSISGVNPSDIIVILVFLGR
jgi:tRNA uridine 5-carboxymethylaminomethyl modification enzyme